MTTLQPQATMGRRDLLKTVMGTLAAVGTMPTLARAAQPLTRIDMHAHLIPDFYRKALADYKVSGDGGVGVPSWSTKSALSFMDKFGFQAQVVSLSEPGFGFLPDRAARQSMAQQINEFIRDELVFPSAGSSLQGRFGGLGSLPLGNADDPAEVAAARAEAVRVIKVLGLDGISLYSNYKGVYLGDPRLDPLMQTLNELGAYVYIHPVAPPTRSTLSIPAFVLDFPFESTRAAANMLYKGIYQRFPSIRWQLSHGGGTIPYLSYRSGLAANNTNPDKSSYAALFYDSALACAPAAMAALRKTTDVSHIMLGTDFPYSWITYAVKLQGDPNSELNQSVTPNERLMIDRGNALTQLPGLARRLGGA
jgi:predicted TIM-barrel fold metal-dependent hydrolase